MHNHGPCDLKKTVITNCCVSLIMVPFGLTERENMYIYFIQDSAMAYTENFSVVALRRGSQYMAHSLWAPRSPHWDLCDCYLWGTLKDDCSLSSPQSLQDLNKIFEENFPVFQDMNLLSMCQEIFSAGARHA